MNKKKKTIISIIALFIIVIIGIFGYMFYSDMKQEKILDDEITKIIDSVLLTDDIDMEIKTKGDYAVVEKTIKSYLNEYVSLSKDIITKMEDKTYQEVLTPANIKKDAPNFTNSEKTITTLNGVTEQIDTITDMSSKEAIMKKIKEKKLDNYYNDLYESIMFDEETIEELNNVKNELVSANNQLKTLVDVYTNAINLLKTHVGKWEISNNQLYFYTNDLANQYNKIIAAL